MASISSHQMKPADREKICQLAGNSRCIDCGRGNPEWGSISLGVLFCLECSGPHRGLGTHISRVRSLAMDSWSDGQIKMMIMGGNDQCKQFLAKHNITWEGTTIKSRYDSPPAELYRQVLKARVEGRPEPTELPKQEPPEERKERPMTGFGSGPDPREVRRRESRKRKKLAAVGVAVGSLALAGWMTLSKKGRGKSKMSQGI